MKPVMPQVLSLASISMIVLLLVTPVAKAETLFGTPFELGKVEFTIQDSLSTPTSAKVSSRRDTGNTKAADFPSFDEVPHAVPAWAEFYIGSRWSHEGELIDVYKMGKIQYRMPTGYFQ